MNPRPPQHVYRITPIALALSMAFAGQALAVDVDNDIGGSNNVGANTVSYAIGNPFGTTATAIITPLTAGGSVLADANPDHNRVTLTNLGSSSDVDIVGGFSIGTGAATTNEVEINATDNATHGITGVVVGGFVNGHNNATGNQVNINTTGTSSITVAPGGNAKFAVSGGSVSINGNATGNQVNIGAKGTSSITITGNPGASAIRGGAVTATGGAVMSVAGDATSNTVNINSTDSGETGTVTITADVDGAFVQDGNAAANTVNIKGNTSVNGNVHGGYADVGTAQYNEVKIDKDSGSTLTVTGSVFGGETGSSGNANYNKVNITGATIGGDIYGGYSALNNANNNKVEISGTNTSGTIIAGGYVDSSGTGAQQANGNQVTISGSAVTADSVVGGRTWGSDTANQASGNAVSIDGTTFYNPGVSVVGGQTFNGQAGAAGQGNTVILTNTRVVYVRGGEVDYGNAQYNEVTIGTGAGVSASVYGGSVTGAGNANHNKVTIAAGTSPVVTGHVYGGSTNDGDASNNTVTYTSGNVGGNIIGGYIGSLSSGTAANNTVNLGVAGDAGLTVGGNLYGGYQNGPGAIATGNTLNVEGVGHIVGGSLGGFETLNFRVANTINPGNTILTVSGFADISGSTVNLAFVAGSSSLSGFTAGTSVINLIDASSGATGIVTNTPFIPGNASIGALTKYNFSLAVNGGNILVATLDSVSTTSPLDPRSKALSEGFLSGVAVLNQAQDFVAQQGINAALAAVSPAGLKQSLQGFAGVGGGNLRHDTGSHVDVDGYSLIAGAAFGKDTGAGTVTVGGFIEHGDSDYTSTNNFANSSVQSAHGKGDTKFTGFGALGRFDFTATNTGKAYVDGSVRVGRVKTDFDSDIFDGFGRSVSFDSKSRYLSAHVDGGYVLNLNARNTLDVYGQFLFSRQNGDSVHLSTGEAVKFKDVNSRRVRVGAKWNFTLSDESSLYAGAAWEHEYDGKANATLNDGLNRYKLDAPDLKGNTSILSVGLAVKPAAGRPLSLDVGIQSHTGKREGVTGSIRAGYRF
ncbi:hypothetical protein FACS1894116_09920 [Betaproteobacteria bacterium]|nr:hypothetical protein FACS1894116_09920 [Betaproteobacteria bacterium]